MIKSKYFLPIFLILIIIPFGVSSEILEESDLENTVNNLGNSDNMNFSLNKFFVENLGQLSNNNIKYYLFDDNTKIGFEKRKVQFLQIFKEPKGVNPVKNSFNTNLITTVETEFKFSTNRFSLKFIGANDVVPQGNYILKSYSNFFIGNDPLEWQTRVQHFTEILYSDLYDNIDLIYYFENNVLKYKFLVKPGADISDIYLNFEGIDKLSIDSSGNLNIHTSFNKILDSAPKAYQNSQEIQCNFKLINNKAYQFECENWDNSQLLIIDPEYSTFLGGSSLDEGEAIATDSKGNIYVTGETHSSDFPISVGAFNTSMNDINKMAFVTKLSPLEDDYVLNYSTYFGGSGILIPAGGHPQVPENEYRSDYTKDITIDSNGNAYITGYTYSNDFPTTSGAFSTTLSSSGGQDAFVFVLNADGTEIVYSSYLGGGGYAITQGWGIALNSRNEIYLTGWTISEDFPITPTAFDDTQEFYTIVSTDAFISIINPIGDGVNDLLYSTFLGGYFTEFAHSIVVDDDDNFYVAGYTDSDNFPTTSGAYDTVVDGNCAFVVKASISGLIYSTVIEGSEWMGLGYAIDIDGSNDVYFTGWTYSEDFPITRGSFKGGSDAFVAKLNLGNNGVNDLIYSTLFGGSGNDQARSITVDNDGKAYITGDTTSNDFDKATNLYMSGKDVFISWISEDGTVSQSEYLGGSADDRGNDIADDGSLLYIVGTTSSTDFPTTTPAFQNEYNGGVSDAFISIFHTRGSSMLEPICCVVLGVAWTIITFVIIAPPIILPFIIFMFCKKYPDLCPKPPIPFGSYRSILITLGVSAMLSSAIWIGFFPPVSPQTLLFSGFIYGIGLVMSYIGLLLYKTTIKNLFKRRSLRSD